MPSPSDTLTTIVAHAVEEALARALTDVPDLTRFRLLKVRDAAAMLSVEETTIRRMIADGELEMVMVRADRRVTVASIDAYIARQRADIRAADRRRRIQRLV